MICRDCGEERKLKAHGLCKACYHRNLQKRKRAADKPSAIYRVEPAVSCGEKCAGCGTSLVWPAKYCGFCEREMVAR